MAVRPRVAGLLLAGPLLLLLVGQLAAAAPAAAHAELASTTPAHGSTLEEAPAEVVLRFTEEVRVVDGGLRLLDADGEEVSTGEPVVHGSAVRWPLPDDLPDDGYLVSWRVVSSDGHPIVGAFSFGVGSPAPEVTGPAAATTAPWPVTAARLGGYVGFTLLAGVVVLAHLCWPGARTDPRARWLLRAGLVTVAGAAVLGLLLQGPYVAGEPLTRLLDRELLAQTSHETFGAWTQLRIYLAVALAALLWPVAGLASASMRRLGIGGAAAMAVTFSGAGHAAGSPLDQAVDSTHVLLAGAWAGGVLALAATILLPGGRPDHASLTRFARLALLAVLGTVVTGMLNSARRLSTVSDLWRSDYGAVLSVKIALVVAVLAAAAVSRVRVRGGSRPRRALLAEAALVGVVLAATSVLAATAPPADSGAADSGAAGSAATEAASVALPLDDEAVARLEVEPADTTGSRLILRVEDPRGELLDVEDVQLQAELPAQEVGRLDLPLRRTDGGWTGEATFPFTGAWRVVLRVERAAGPTLVTAGDLEIR